MISESDIARIADAVIDRLSSRPTGASSAGNYIRGTLAIARFIGVSEDTYRRKHRSKVPICGTEEYNHRGKTRLRPVCRVQDLKRYRENLPSKNKREV